MRILCVGIAGIVQLAAFGNALNLPGFRAAIGIETRPVDILFVGGDQRARVQVGGCGHRIGIAQPEIFAVGKAHVPGLVILSFEVQAEAVADVCPAQGQLASYRKIGVDAGVGTCGIPRRHIAAGDGDVGLVPIPQKRPDGGAGIALRHYGAAADGDSAAGAVYAAADGGGLACITTIYARPGSNLAAADGNIAAAAVLAAADGRALDSAFLGKGLHSAAADGHVSGPALAAADNRPSGGVFVVICLHLAAGDGHVANLVLTAADGRADDVLLNRFYRAAADGHATTADGGGVLAFRVGDGRQ